MVACEKWHLNTHLVAAIVHRRLENPRSNSQQTGSAVCYEMVSAWEGRLCQYGILRSKPCWHGRDGCPIRTKQLNHHPVRSLSMLRGFDVAATHPCKEAMELSTPPGWAYASWASAFSRFRSSASWNRNLTRPASSSFCAMRVDL
jgi:hypothetical protein